MLALGIMLSGCPTATNSGRMNLGLGSAVSPDLAATANRICENSNGRRNPNCDVNAINSGRHMSAPSPCDDGNCPRPHMDRTSSVPPIDLSEVGYENWTQAQINKARNFKWCHKKNAEGKCTKYGSAGDYSRGGYRCAKGVRLMLQHLGLPLKRDPPGGPNGRHYYENMQQSPGWKKVDCQPSNCPAGAVLVYDRNSDSSTWDGSGREHGHVEMVLPDGSGGGNKFCSDFCGSNPGGSVPHNFKGAFVYVGNE